MDFLHPVGNYGKHNGKDMWGGQRERVHSLCKELAKEGWARRFPDTKENRKWFEKFLIRVADEVENQC